MPGQRGQNKEQTSISLDSDELKEMREEIERRGLRGLGHLLEVLWEEKKKKQTKPKK